MAIKKYYIDKSNNSDNAYLDPKKNPDISIRWSRENIAEYKQCVTVFFCFFL